MHLKREYSTLVLVSPFSCVDIVWTAARRLFNNVLAYRMLSDTNPYPLTIPAGISQELHSPDKTVIK